VKAVDVPKRRLRLTGPAKAWYVPLRVGLGAHVCTLGAGVRVWSETLLQVSMGSRCKSGAAPATVTGDELGQIHWSVATLWEGPA
jgi:hypothetical protein